MTGDMRNYHELDQLPDNQQELMAEFERRKRARLIHVSTDDLEVKSNLRQLQEPICKQTPQWQLCHLFISLNCVCVLGLFGEGPAERRERLKTLISELSEDEIAQKLKKKEELERREEESQNEVTWYHEGSEEMRLSRIAIAQYSLRR